MNLNKLHIICFLSMLLSLSLQAQELVVKGTVNDETGMPIPGASILLKGTTTGVASDFDGNFELKTPSNATLIFSYLGYKTIEESVNGRTTILVSLEPDLQALEEVVIVGYGAQKKSVVTGAISGVKQSDLEDLPITRIEHLYRVEFLV